MVIAVMSGSGGVGGSVFSCALALAAARAGWRTALVDGDSLGGGIDVTLGIEDSPGPRWPDFANATGELDPQGLASMLLSTSGLAVLAHSRTNGVPVPSVAQLAVVSTLAAHLDLVVLDVSRHQSDVLLSVATQVVVVSANSVRSVAASKALVASLGVTPQLVVAKGFIRALPIEAIGRTIGLDPMATWALESSVAESLERGDYSCLLRTSKDGVVAAAQSLLPELVRSRVAA